MYSQYTNRASLSTPVDRLRPKSYNERVKSLGDWLNSQFVEWQQHEGKRKELAEFAVYLGVHPVNLSRWMSGAAKTPSDENIVTLAAKLGPEIYDVLGLPRPDERLGKIIEVWGRLSEAEREALAERAEQAAGAEGDSGDEPTAAVYEGVGKGK